LAGGSSGNLSATVSTGDRDPRDRPPGRPRRRPTARERAEIDELHALLDAPLPREPPAQAVRWRTILRAISGRRMLLSLLPAIALVAGVVVLAIVLSGGHDKAPRAQATLRGTALAPHAHGSAKLVSTHSGWRINLAADGLPRLGAGRYYEVWLQNATGAQVPVGSFNASGHVTMWAGVPALDYPTLTVTEQLVGEALSASSRRVLAGRLTRQP
jgi:hypothetical protein